MAQLVLDHEAGQNLVRLGGAVGLALLGAALAAAIAAQNILLATALLALIGFVVVFPFPRLAVVIVILFAQVQYLFTSPYGSLVSYPIFPTAFQWLDEMVLLALLGNLTLTKLLKGRDRPLEKAPALMPLALLFGVGVLSARLNGIPLLTGLLGQRYVFEMVILYLAIINLDLDERFLRGLIYLLLGIGVFQAAVGILEFAHKFRLYTAGNHDIVQGTWGGGSANHVGVFFLCLAALVAARLRRRWYGPTAALFGIYLVLLCLTSCRSGIVLAPLVVLFVLREWLKYPKSWIALALGLIFLTASLAFYYRNTDAEITEDLGVEEFNYQVMGRTSVIPVMSQVLRNYSRFAALGAGPGTYLTAMGGIHGSDMYREVEAMARTGQVVAPFITASYAVVWMEYGVVGLALFGVVLLCLFMFAWRQEKLVQSLFWKDYFRALQAIIVVYALIGGIFPLWTHFMTNIYLWLFPAIGVRYVVLQRRMAAQAARAVTQPEATILQERPIRRGLGASAVER